MKNAFKKLNSRNGATIIMALLFFLICAVIGGIVLASAAANAGRLGHIRDEHRAYFSLSSAAKLVRDEITEAEFTQESKLEEPPGGSPVFEEPELTGGGAFAGVIKDFARDITENGTEPPPVNFIITPDMAGDMLGEATATIKMDLDYNISITIEDDNEYKMSLSLRADAPEPEETITRDWVIPPESTGEDPYEKVTTETKYTVTWNLAVITKGAA